MFTLGTLAVIAAIGLIGYAAGAATRSAPVDVPLDGAVEGGAAV